MRPSAKNTLDREVAQPALLRAGFRPFFLFAAAWAAIAVPVWLAAYVHGYALGGALPAALHALTIGAIGTMTLAVMTRATLGHTGRPLAAGPATCAIYAMVSLGAVLRVAAPLSGAGAVLLTSLAGVAWTAAFALFVLTYGPMLLGAQQSA